jgi:hypothetical protein
MVWSTRKKAAIGLSASRPEVQTLLCHSRLCLLCQDVACHADRSSAGDPGRRSATGVARINRWTAREKSLRLCRTAVVLKGTQHRIDVVHITGAVEVAALVATKIVALGGHGARAVSPRVVCDNAVLKIHGRTVGHSPTRTKCGIPADRAAIDYDNSTVVVVDSAAEARRSSVKNITSSIPSDCTIRNRQLAFIEDPATEGRIASELGAGEIGQVICDCALANYHRGTCVVVNTAAHNAPGSPQTALLSGGMATVVKLNPKTLGFACLNDGPLGSCGCTPPQQTATLTNAGSTQLDITDIAISGSSTFSQTNQKHPARVHRQPLGSLFCFPPCKSWTLGCLACGGTSLGWCIVGWRS